mmetsp:Transcript_24777/g.65037  ORF Transcript_24777/g.65037 Transcript_24777/m.65037 type:complete len:358 (-) Transcript_24777:115-1188(-)
MSNAGLRPRKWPGKVVLGKYVMGLRSEHLLGEGTSSICRWGRCLSTGEKVAVKVYKMPVDEVLNMERTLVMFRRQIEVLQELAKPLKQPTDSGFWHPALGTLESDHFFVRLFDYSRDLTGAPGPDPEDGRLYIVTEFAKYSLATLLRGRRTNPEVLQPHMIRKLVAATTLVVAALHAKGLVHMDLKPANLMVVRGRVKLIDVDGCRPIGSVVSKKDSAVCYSVSHCSPEWARFVVEHQKESVEVTPAMDVWSLGVTLSGLVLGHSLVAACYAQHTSASLSHSLPEKHFLTWLGNLDCLPTVDDEFDNEHPDLVEAIQCGLLVLESSSRMTAAEFVASLNDVDDIAVPGFTDGDVVSL